MGKYSKYRELFSNIDNWLGVVFTYRHLEAENLEFKVKEKDLEQKIEFLTKENV